MSDLVEFLRARLDEDEKRAKRGCRRNLPRHPRALREVEAKRAILTALIKTTSDKPGDLSYDDGLADGLRFTALEIAAVYSGHPDYDPAWG